jgi:5-methylcytosine-specific restriction endonuclease McrA
MKLKWAQAKELYERDNWTCQYCGWNARKNFTAWRHLSADHVVRQADGGHPTSLDNLKTACDACNRLFNKTKFASFEDKKAKIKDRLETEQKEWEEQGRVP